MFSAQSDHLVVSASAFMFFQVCNMLVNALEVLVGSNLGNRLEFWHSVQIWHRKLAPHLFRMCNPMNQLKEITSCMDEREFIP